MAGETISTNMGMPVPGVGVTAGPQWATDVVNSLNIIDAHDHSAGSGVRITPDGLNISSDLSFQTTSSATNLYKASFSSQSAALTGTNFLSFISGNLYVNDSSGNQIPITSAGGVAGSPGSIGSLTSPASATYTAGSKLFTWLADSGKSAAMDNGAVTIRETNVASSKGVTLAAPGSLAADYQITLLSSLPASTQLINITSSGVTGNISYDGVGSAMTATGANAIGATMTSTGANAVAATRTRSTGTSVAAGGIAISTSSSLFTTSSGSFVDVTNLSVTIITSGRPIFITLVGDGSANHSALSVSNLTNSGTQSIYGSVKILRDATAVGIFDFGSNITLSAGTMSAYASNVPSGSIIVLDAVAAGTYTIKAQVANVGSSSSQLIVAYCKLIAYEL